MASEDFVIDIGLNLNDKEIRSQLQELRSSVIKPFQADFAKTINRPFNMAQRTKLVSRGISAAEKVYNIHSGAITPFEAVRMTLKGSQKTGTPQREMQDEMVAGLKTRIKRNNIIREQEIKSIRTHLKEMGGYTTPLESIQQQIRQETFDKTQQQVNELVEAKNAEERRLAIEEHQKKILEIIAKNTGVFKKWNQVDKAIVQREQRSILRSLTPGEGLTDYQKKVLGTGFGVDFKKLASTGLSFAGVVGGIAKLVGRELVREGSLLSKQASITGYSLQKERTLSDMGMQDPSSVLSDIATFNDRLRLGEVDLQGYGMFARRTLATRRQTNDPLAIWQAFKMDVAEAEARGWTKETVAQKTGMTAWLPTLEMKEEDVAKLWGRAASGIEQEKRAYGAHMRGKWFRNVGRSIDDLTSDEKAATIAGQVLGGVGAAAAVAMTGGTALIPLTAAGVAGATAGGVGSALLADQLPDSAVSLADVQDTVRNAPNTTVNVRIDSDAMQTLINGNEYTKTFSVSSISDMY